MEIFNLILEKYGLKTAIILFILKTFWEVVVGSTKKYIKAIDTNTEAINKLTVKMDKVSEDLRVAFINIKQIRAKQEMGPLSIDVDQ